MDLEKIVDKITKDVIETFENKENVLEKNGNKSSTPPVKVSLEKVAKLKNSDESEPEIQGIGENNIANLIDHTLLKPNATKEQILKLCKEAKEYGFASCCVNPIWVSLVADCLKGSGVKTCVVVGFPLGANSTLIKAMETRDAVAAGADEIDMVMNLGALKERDYQKVKDDIEMVVKASGGRVVKVILETALLTDEEKIKACQWAQDAGADFVKTSTGFGPGGATVEDVALMRKTVGKHMGVKASGGIRDYKKAIKMIGSGATRIGASSSVSIVKEGSFSN